MTRVLQTVALATSVILASTFDAAAQTVPERLCDTQLENCRAPLLTLIQNEKIGIDVAFWYMSDARYVSALINARNRGVPVRVLVDERASNSKPNNAPILDALRDAGIPMREKIPDLSYSIQILHFKMMLFAGQNIVGFSKANFTPFEYVPVAPNNYSDEAIFFTNDDRLTNSFRRRFDDLWTNTSVYRNYANISGPLARSYPVYTIDPAMNFVPLQDFQIRAKGRFDAEPKGGQIDVIVYRATDHLLPDAAISAVARGVPVRLITDYGEYRNLTRRWDAAQKDRMWLGGVQMKVGNHGGEVHEAAVVLHGLGEVIFGSSNWSTASANEQDEHNFFYSPGFGKPWFFEWFADQFDRKWNDSTNYPAFKPLPPDTPSYTSPMNAASGQSTNITLRWEGGPWAHFYDIYMGTTSNPPLLGANLQIGSPDDGQSEAYTVNGLLSGTTYYWRIVGKTWAELGRSGPVWSFTTSGTPPVGGSTPFGGAPAAVPGTFQAENFDDGGLNVAYYDATSGNSGGAYRSTDVDIEATTDTGGGYNVGWTRAGEWLKYTVNVAAAGTYQLQTRVANTAAGAAFHIEVDGVDATSAIVVPNTGGWQTWQTITTTGISLSAGRHVIRVVFTTAAANGGVGNYNWFRLDPASGPSTSSPFGGTPAAVPGTLQAENFDNGGQNVAYFDTTSGNSGGAYRSTDVDIEATTDTGGGNNVGWTGAGEWLKYTVNVAAAGAYQLQTRVANTAAGAAFHVEVDGVDATSAIAVPNTGGWQTWQTITTSGISLTAGQHVVRIVFTTAGSNGVVGNYNWFRLDTSSSTPSNTPFGGTPAPIPGTVQAENFDNGGQNVAYFDTTSGNSTGAYRSTDVDIEPTTDTGGGYDVAKTRAGEWLKYTVNIGATGTYQLQTRVAAVGTGGTFRVEVDGVDKTGSIAVPDTGGWQTWQTVTTSGISLTAGQHVVRLVFVTAGSSGGVGNFGYFSFQ